MPAPVVEAEAGTENTSVLTGVEKEFLTQLRLSQLQQQTQDHRNDIIINN